MKIVFLLMKCIIIIILAIPTFIVSVLVSIIALIVIFISGMIWVSDFANRFVNKTFDP